MALMALRENLVTRPRENSGSRSANRFDFQRDWSLCHLLELHDKGGEYVMVFEHHDDLATLDSEADPQKIKLVQIKKDERKRFLETSRSCKKENSEKTAIAIYRRQNV